MALEIQCPGCSLAIPIQGPPGFLTVRCPRCSTSLEVNVFPAMFKLRGGVLPDAVEAETDASCFFHPRNRAAVTCGECGRFLCKLCELEVAGAPLCPDCFNKGVRTGRAPQLEGQRTMHDSVALAMALFPVLFWPIWVISGPATLFWVAKNWNTTRSIVPRSRVRFYFAALIAVAEIVGVVLLIFAIVRAS